MKLKTIEIVSATRMTESEFWANAALGISLRRFANDARLRAHIAFENARGLPEVFNAHIAAASGCDILVFMHDDVWIDDASFADRVIEGLENFDVIGVAGNRRIAKNHRSWAFIDEKFTWDEAANLSGDIAHGKYPFGVISVFGPTAQSCELLDGVFIAANKSKLQKHGVQFDPRFGFHFYDLDFCRSARCQGLRLGTWQISLTHQSEGGFGSQDWLDKFHLYQQKWETVDGNGTIQRPSRSTHNVPTSPMLPIKWLKGIFANPDRATSKNHGRQTGGGIIPLNDLLSEFKNFIKRGNDFLSQGSLNAAAACYGHAIAVNPSAVEGFLNLGFALLQMNLHLEAEHYLKHVILMNPNMEDAHYLLGSISQERGCLDEAISHFNTALALKPDFENVYHGLCPALFLSGKIEAAKHAVQKALELNAQCAEFHSYQGNLYYHEKQMALAIACYQEALRLQPDYLQVHVSMGNVLLQMGQVDAAIDAYKKTLAIDPDLVEADSCLLFIRASHPQGSPEQYLAAAQHYGKRLVAQVKPFTQWPICHANHEANPLRVGLVSGDLNNHPVGYFLESTLRHLNPERIALVAYSASSQEDEMTARLKPYFSAWNSIVGVDDEAAARKIHADGIHILIDLSGHTTLDRLPVFAWKPAPVQVSWLGYFASTGVPGMDYLLADPVSVPESHRGHFTEHVWYLPSTRMCFTPPTPIDQLLPGPLPCTRNGYITFGCFQNLTKITDAVLSTWARIFQALPQAKLRLQIKQVSIALGSREEILQRLSRCGIEHERVILEGYIPRADYLAAHAEVDIILDTFPYPGGTTTCEALWMGVPTLTLAGNTMLSRQGASFLSCAGLTDWIANNEDDYVNLALAHASDIQKLAQLRDTLRQHVLGSPLFDAPRFALDLEEALTKMWQRKMSACVEMETAKLSSR